MLKLIAKSFNDSINPNNIDRVNLQSVANLVRDRSSDRRYGVKFLAATSPVDSAILQYKGRRIYVSYNSRTKSYKAEFYE